MNLKSEKTKSSSCALSLAARFHSLFYAVSFMYRIPRSYRAAFWLIERLIVITPLLLPVFADTSWDSLQSALVNLNVSWRFKICSC